VNKQSPGDSHSAGDQARARALTPPACAVWLALLFLPICTGCLRAPDRAPYPHESVLTVIAELKIFLNEDPYRQPPGRDLEGLNIYRVSLSRIEELMALTGEDYLDILLFARAECLERLGLYGEAAAAFERAAAIGTTLAEPAAERGALARQLADQTSRETWGATLDAYLTGLEAARRRLQDWQAESPPWPYEAYLNAEIEQLAVERALLLFTSRLVLARATEQALAAAEELVVEHRQSFRHGEHLILLGDFHETLAREWTQRERPERNAEPGPGQPYEGWVLRARQAYREAAQRDGDPAKPEAQGRLRALDAFDLRMQALGR